MNKVVLSAKDENLDLRKALSRQTVLTDYYYMDSFELNSIHELLELCGSALRRAIIAEEKLGAKDRE